MYELLGSNESPSIATFSASLKFILSLLNSLYESELHSSKYFISFFFCSYSFSNSLYFSNTSSSKFQKSKLNRKKKKMLQFSIIFFVMF